MKQRDIQPLFIDSSDAPIDPGMKIFYRAKMQSSMFHDKSPIYYECYAFHHATEHGFWVRGRNGWIDKTGKFREALVFVRNNQDLDYGTLHWATAGFCQSTKAKARLALAYRVASGYEIVERQLADYHHKALALIRQYPDLGEALAGIVPPVAQE